MIPAKIVAFFDLSLVMTVGTRNEQQRPSVAYAYGGAVHAEDDSITFFLPDVEGGAILRDLKQNGRVAFTAAFGITHETYRFEGKCNEARPVNEQEKALQDAYKKRRKNSHRGISLLVGREFLARKSQRYPPIFRDFRAHHFALGCPYLVSVAIHSVQCGGNKLPPPGLGVEGNIVATF